MTPPPIDMKKEALKISEEIEACWRDGRSHYECVPHQHIIEFATSIRERTIMECAEVMMKDHVFGDQLAATGLCTHMEQRDEILSLIPSEGKK